MLLRTVLVFHWYSFGVKLWVRIEIELEGILVVCDDTFL